MASQAQPPPRSPLDTTRRRRDTNRSAYVTLGAVRYAVRRAPPPARCPCRCCTSGELLAACLGRDHRTLDRLQRFRFGRAASGERERRAGSADRPRDRAERLRELTERLRGARASPATPAPHPQPVLPPVPPPRTRHSKGSPTREPSLCCASPPVQNQNSQSEDFFDADDIRLVKVEPRSIVGSYAQKTIPFRSASFSQGDTATENYYRGAATTVRQPSIFDFGRRPQSKSLNSTTRESVEPLLSTREVEETTEGGSTASVDSAVGSDEGLLAHTSPAPRSPPPDSPHKLGARSLTHPLPRRGSQDRPVPGGSLQFLTTPRVLHEVREESDASLADSAQPHSEAVSPSDSASPFRFPASEPQACPNVDCGCTSSRVVVTNARGEMREAVACATPVPIPVYECIVKEWCSSMDENDKDGDETITSEQVESLLAAVKNPTATPVVPIASSNKERRRSHDKMKRRKGIYITNEVNLEDLPEPLVNGLYKKCDADAPADPRDSLASEARTNSSAFGDKSDDSTANGPPSPGDAIAAVWPRLDVETHRRRSRLSHQSSDERDDDSVRLRRSGNAFLRTESPSDGESESGASRGRTSSPSPAHATPEASDAEVRRTVRPVRGPYLRNVLDASPTLRPNRSFDERETSRRSFSDATVPQRKASAGSAPRPTPTHVRATSSPSKLSELRAAGGEEFLAQLLRGSSEALSNSNSFANVILCLQQHNDTRTHVVVELYETEKSYVEALQTIVKKYLQPLKSPENSGLVDPCLVDEIFYQVPSILAVHEVFLEELRRRLEQWDVNQKVGDVFIDVFAKPSVMETYMLFINNWKKAKETIRSARSARPAFAKFLDSLARDHKGKLSLDNLLIKPVQKFPSYELLLQRLIKHTDSSHPDHKLLLDAQKEIHELLLKINYTERESLELEQQQLCLRELEQLIEGLSNLVSQERSFISHEVVTMPCGSGASKERCLFLFSDLVLITSVKRRTGTIKKPIPTYHSSVASTLEGSKYKLLMRIALTDLEVLKAKDERTRQVLQEVETLVEDVAVLTQISELVGALHVPHGSLEDTVRDLLQQTGRQLTERQGGDARLCRLELSVDTRSGVENLTLIFSKTENRSKWEALINQTKQKLCACGHERPAPEFLSPVPIRKTRAGLQFTCAAPTIPPPGQSPDVWVCNSDGYVGQVCVLTLSPRPQVTSCNGVCNARILCVACIPAFPLKNDIDLTLASCTGSATKPGISISDADESCKNIRLDSSSSSDEDDDGSSTSETQDTHSESKSQESVSNLRSLNLTSGLGRTHTLTPSHCKSLSTPYTGQSSVHPVMKSSSNPAVDKQAMGIPSGTFSSPASRQSSEDSGAGAHQPTMWLGTEDGFIHVYNCNDNIRIKKNKVKLQHSSTVLRIVYVDSKVFVALGSGEMVVYVRDIDGAWTEQCTLSVGTGASPVSSTVLYNNKLWCATHTTIKIVNPQTLTVEDTFQVGSDSLKPISHMAVHGAGVWLSLHNTATLRCFRAHTRELLADINITPYVTKMLHGCDDIIRQHKAACLRVTSLLARDGTLWIGTSAGVLLTAPLHNSPDNNGVFTLPQIVGVNYGHTGHVRFLTYVENPVPSIPKPTQAASKNKLLNRRSANLATSQKPPETTSTTEVLVISGGDGFEDFRSATSNEDAGREDSTNHLLLWRV